MTTSSATNELSSKIKNLSNQGKCSTKFKTKKVISQPTCYTVDQAHLGNAIKLIGYRGSNLENAAWDSEDLEDEIFYSVL